MLNDKEYNIFVSDFHELCQMDIVIKKETDPLKAKLLKMNEFNLLHTLKRNLIGGNMNKVFGIVLILFISGNLFSESTNTSVSTATATSTSTSTSTIPEKKFLHTGFSFDAVLKNQIVSYNFQTPIIAETEVDIIYLKKVVIPKGTKIIGYASTTHSEDRVIVQFNTLVFPDGSEIPFSGMGLMTDGSAGLVGEVKKAQYKSTVNTIMSTAGNAIGGIGGAIAQGLAGESQKQMDTSIPDTIITVKKDIGLLVYNITRLDLLQKVK